MIPAVCQKCGLPFRARINDSGAIGLEMVDCKTNCPRCGGESVILDGIYSDFFGTITNPQHFKMLMDAVADLQKMAEQNRPAEEIAKKIDEKYPFLSYLKGLMPKDCKEVTALLKVVLDSIAKFTIGAGLMAHGAGNDSAEIKRIVKETLREAAHQLASGQTASHAKDHKARPAPQVYMKPNRTKKRSAP